LIKLAFSGFKTPKFTSNFATFGVFEPFQKKVYFDPYLPKMKIRLNRILSHSFADTQKASIFIYFETFLDIKFMDKIGFIFFYLFCEKSSRNFGFLFSSIFQKNGNLFSRGPFSNSLAKTVFWPFSLFLFFFRRIKPLLAH